MHSGAMVVSPFSWKERRVLLRDQVLFVPEYYKEYSSFEMPSWDQIFDNDNPIHLEYCSGNGHWVIERAQNHPDQNWVAVEKKFERVRKIWSKREKRGLKNLFIVSGEALTATRHYFPTSSIEAAYINFPDPWPKRRHSKHRLISDAFASEVGRILKPNAPFILATDDPQTEERFVKVVAGNPAFGDDPLQKGEWPGYGSSWFEELWRSKGRKIRYVRCDRRLSEADLKCG